jgi:hypothetical protein
MNLVERYVTFNELYQELCVPYLGMTKEEFLHSLSMKIVEAPAFTFRFHLPEKDGVHEVLMIKTKDIAEVLYAQRSANKLS